MSDAQIDSGNTGQAGEDLANSFIGERDNAQAVFFYGSVSLITAASSIVLYIILNEMYWVARTRAFFLTHIEFFAPVGMAWLMVSFFDSEFMRTVFADVVMASIMGPFFAHWYVIIEFFLAGEVGGQEWSAGDSSITAYDELFFWTTMAAMGALTIFEMILQVVLLPQVFEWVEEAPELDND